MENSLFKKGVCHFCGWLHFISLSSFWLPRSQKRPKNFQKGKMVCFAGGRLLLTMLALQKQLLLFLKNWVGAFFFFFTIAITHCLSVKQGRNVSQWEKSLRVSYLIKLDKYK